jgi:hypothetical protein
MCAPAIRSPNCGHNMFSNASAGPYAATESIFNLLATMRKPFPILLLAEPKNYFLHSFRTEQSPTQRIELIHSCSGRDPIDLH